MKYTDRLQDPRWQKKRLQIFERDNWTCLHCGSKEKSLQVHHLIYGKKDPWDYPDEVYQTLCCDCHEIRHELIDKAVNALRLSLKNIPTERLEKITQRLISEAFAEL